jgi:hypothetical protein
MNVPINTETNKPIWTPEEARNSLIDQGYSSERANNHAQKMYRERRQEQDRETELRLARKAGSIAADLVLFNGQVMHADEARALNSR